MNVLIRILYCYTSNFYARSKAKLNDLKDSVFSLFLDVYNDFKRWNFSNVLNMLTVGVEMFGGFNLVIVPAETDQLI
jgi:hypothetical protein